MLVVIEGTDRVGKSTLVTELKRLVTALGRRVVTIHRGVPEPASHPLVDYALPISTYSPAHADDKVTHSLICDRLHIGDFVYGPLYRDGPRQTPAQRAFTDALIEARGGVKVHLTASAAIVRSRCEKAGEDYLKAEHINQVINKFERECSDGTWARLDTSSWGSENDTHFAAREILTAAREAERRALPVYQAAPDYIGPWKPAGLIVTDPDFFSDPGSSYATATPWNGTAADYLCHAIIDARLSMSKNIGIVGADAPDLEGLHRLLGQPKVIVVGSPHLLNRSSIHPVVRYLPAPLPRPAANRGRAIYGREIRAAMLRPAVSP